ncbi:MAG: hypothetical protein WD002_06075 [Pseudomonadales bacterium]
MRVIVLLLSFSMAGCQALRQDMTPAPSLSFALIGDNPYVEFNVPKYETMIDEINSTEGLSWLIHLGDVKSSGQSCSDEVLKARFEMNQRIDLPFIFTPGDNDWFDCHRKSAGGWDPIDRLSALRRIWFPDPRMTTGARPFEVVTQANSPAYSDFVENVYWSRDKVIFGTVHLVGITPGEGGIEIHEALMAAGLAWIEEIFEVADRMDANGVFLATQVDPYLATVFPGLLASICPACPYVRPGYEALDEALAQHARRFGKPVVLAVGDTHIFRVDKPLYDDSGLVENFTRVEVFGHPSVHWVRVVVEPDTDEVFQFRQELIEANYGVGWPE